LLVAGFIVQILAIGKARPEKSADIVLRAADQLRGRTG
jgi:hypothetical protein